MPDRHDVHGEHGFRLTHRSCSGQEPCDVINPKSAGIHKRVAQSGQRDLHSMGHCLPKAFALPRDWSSDRVAVSCVLVRAVLPRKPRGERRAPPARRSLCKFSA